MGRKFLGWLFAILCVFFLISSFVGPLLLGASINPLTFLFPTAFGFLAYYFFKSKKSETVGMEKKSDLSIWLKAFIYLVEGFLCILIPAIIAVTLFEDMGETTRNWILLVLFIVCVWFMPSPKKVVNYFKEKGTNGETENQSNIAEMKETEELTDDINEIFETNERENETSEKSKLFEEVYFASKNNIELQIESNKKSIESSIKVMEEKKTIKRTLAQNSFSKRIVELNPGLLRLLITVGVILSFYFSIRLVEDFWNYFPDDLIRVILYAILLFIVYWIVVRVILWIYDGFVEGKK